MEALPRSFQGNCSQEPFIGAFSRAFNGITTSNLLMEVLLRDSTEELPRAFRGSHYRASLKYYLEHSEGTITSNILRELLPAAFVLKHYPEHPNGIVTLSLLMEALPRDFQGIIPADFVLKHCLEHSDGIVTSNLLMEPLPRAL